MKRRGFTLIEVLVAMGLLTLIIVGFLSLFDTSVKVSKAQSATADVQESLRYVMANLVRMTRMAGAGGIPAVVPGVASARLGAVNVRNNVGVGGNPNPPLAGRTPIAGTDVLELRGAFTGEVYDIVLAAGGDYSYTGPTGQVVIPANSITGEPQDTTPLELRVDSSVTPPLWAPVVIASLGTNTLALDNGRSRDFGQYGVGIVNAKDSATRTFTFTSLAAVTGQQDFLDLNPAGAYPAGFNRDDVVRVSVINDIVYFVALDDDGVPTLYQHDIILDRNEPVVSDIIDLQVELGCDVNVNGTIETVAAAAQDDEWLFNFVGESTADLSDPGNAGSRPLVFYLREVRLSLVGRIPAGDMKYRQPPNGTGGRQNEFYFADGRDLLADPNYRSVNVSNFRYRALAERVKLRSVGPIT